MTFERWGCTFDGAYASPDQLGNRGGVYVVWCKRNGYWPVVDVGESDEVRDRLKNHERADCWGRECERGTLYYAATYEDSEERRLAIEHRIRAAVKPPCGKR